MSMTPAKNEKNFKPGCFFRYFVEILLGCCLHSYNYFLHFMFTLRCRQADIVATVSSPVSLLPAINYRQCSVTGD